MSGTLYSVLVGTPDVTDVAVSQDGESVTDRVHGDEAYTKMAKPVAFKSFLSTVSDVGISPTLLNELPNLRFFPSTWVLFPLHEDSSPRG